jgi:ergothioneine biosynthesis protein EgtB
VNLTKPSIAKPARSEEPIVPLSKLTDWVREAMDRSLELVADLTDEQLMGPRLAIVNPLLWEIGHTAWFQEKWVLLHASGEKPIRSDADALYDSIAIPHDTRWVLPLPSRQDTLEYMRRVRDRVLEKLDQPAPSQEMIYFATYCVFHADMHNEAFTYTRQTLGYPAPCISMVSPQDPGGDRSPSVAARIGADRMALGDVEIPGGEFLLGASRDERFVFDNEKWAHPVKLKPFAMARSAVTQAEFLGFVEEGGYLGKEFWSDAGWRWREAAQAELPLYWKRDADGMRRRHFDRWVPLEPRLPVIHVNWYEAEAYCKWARRRLPTEAEWEAAAAAQPQSSASKLSSRKRRFPWGDEPPQPEQANLDWQGGGCIDASALPQGDTVFGCRQMIGNVWEWTSSPFLPYPGFVPDAYKEYSEPWFETHQVLRGGCWATRSRFIRNTYRNFYTPDRRDVWAGFRTCRAAE